MLVLLDRDGVICEDIANTGVLSLSQLKLIPNAAKAIASLNRLGVKVAIVTNQSAVGKGLISEAQLEQIHVSLSDMLAAEGAHWDALYYCTDAPDAPTHRRKPAPGMLQEAISDFDESPANVAMVGDALRDLQAAAKAGCPRYLVRTGKGKATEEQGLEKTLLPCHICDDLSAAVGRILQDFQWHLPRQ